MEEAETYYVEMQQLLERSGELIAGLFFVRFGEKFAEIGKVEALHHGACSGDNMLLDFSFVRPCG